LFISLFYAFSTINIRNIFINIMTKYLFSTKISFFPADSRLLKYSELPEVLRSLHPVHAEPDDIFIAPWGSEHCYPKSDFLVTAEAYAEEDADPSDLKYGSRENEYVTIECENVERYGKLQIRFNAVCAEGSRDALTGVEVKQEDGWKELVFRDLIDEEVYAENVDKYGLSLLSLHASAHNTLVKALMSQCSRMTYGEAEAVASVALNFAKNDVDADDLNFTSYLQENACCCCFDEMLAVKDNAEQWCIIRECDLNEEGKKVLLEDSIDNGLIVLSSRFERAVDGSGECGAEEIAGRNMYVVIGSE